MIGTITTFYRTRFTQGSFARNVLIMFIGTALGQFGSIVLAPALTRLYTPEMFGVLGLFTASMSILSVIAALRYEMALPLAQSAEDAANLLAVCIVSLLCMTGLVGLTVQLLSVSHPGVLGALMPYRWLLPVGFFCIGAYQVIMYYATRQGDFAMISRTKIYQGTVGPLSQIGFGLGGMGNWGLIVGFILGQSTGVSMLFWRLIVLPRAFVGVSLAGMNAMAARFHRFPLISSWSGLLEAAGSSHMLLVVIPLLYSHAIAGFVFLTDRIIGRPLLLISTSILQVYVGDMSRLVNEDPSAMRQRFLQLALHQLLIVTAWLTVVNVAAPTLLPVIFGEEWRPAVAYLQVLSIAYLPQMVVHALIHTLQVLERQAMSAVWECGRLAAVCGAFAISYAYGFSALQALLAYSIVQAAAQVILFILMYNSIQSRRKESSHV